VILPNTTLWFLSTLIRTATLFLIYESNDCILSTSLVNSSTKASKRLSTASMSHLSILNRETATRPSQCTKDTCPASYSIYGYAPNLGANAFFVALFAISCLVFCYQARLYRKWLGFSIAMVLGTALESIGIFLPFLPRRENEGCADSRGDRLCIPPHPLQ
jgi:hypothetical protein